MHTPTMIDQLRDWADALERGEEPTGIVAGIREVAADIEDEGDPPEGTLLCEGENDYLMKDDAETAWVLVKNIAVYIKRTDEGVVVDLYRSGQEDDDEGLMTSTYAFFADAKLDEEG